MTSGCAEGQRWPWYSFFTVETGEGENADADQDQQGGEECLKHGGSSE